MKNYFYWVNNKKIGPFTIDELKKEKIFKDYLIWTNGEEEWKPANLFPELDDIVISEPPPLPNNTHTTKNYISTEKEKFNISLRKLTGNKTKSDSLVQLIGLSVLAIQIICSFFHFVGSLDNELFKAINLIFIVFRLVVCVSVIIRANELNLNSVWLWGLFGFFLPSICLIVIGKNSGNKIVVYIDSSLSISEQIDILMKKADEFFIKEETKKAKAVLKKLMK